jgi:branched-chain amino acid transport system permease protein
MLLFMVASGLTVVFGLMRVMNLSHGTLYLVGAYSGFAVERSTGNFWLALIAAPLVGATVGLVIERSVRARLYSGALNQVLLTLGLAFLIGDLLLWQFGGTPLALSPAPQLEGSITLGTIVYPTYRLALLIVGALMAAGIGVVWESTRLGAILRAGVDDAPILQALGVNLGLVTALTFTAGAALAALGGVAGAPVLGIYTGQDLDVLLYSLVVVVVGGLGSLRGALVGSLLVGILDTFSKAYVPEFAYFSVFGPVLLVLALRPAGLAGRIIE